MALCCRRAAAAFCFASIQTFIGPPKEILNRVFSLDQRTTDRNRGTQFLIVCKPNRRSCHQGNASPGKDTEELSVCIVHNGHEFVTTPSADDVGRAE